MHWGDMGGWGWGGWLAGVLMMLVFWGGLAAVILLAVRRPGEGRSNASERILAERFARGEIDEEEYERRRQVLR